MSTLVFDKYRIERRIAVGGMGEIFLARQVGMFDRPVIIKTLLADQNTSEDWSRDERRVQEFLDEARVLAKLNHPNIVSVHEVGSWRGQHMMVMEYVRGVSLAGLQCEVVSGDGTLSPQGAARVIHDAALGLAHAHTAKDDHGKPLNIVHRDVSPQNIMLRDDCVVKVVDFGIAAAEGRIARTRTGFIKGKVYYISPEQVQARFCDARADQYALGVVLWEMFTGKPMRDRNASDTATMQSILSQPPQAPSELVPELPAQLESIVLRMLSRNPQERFTSCTELATHLRPHFADAEDTESELSALVDAALKRGADRPTTGADYLLDLQAPGALATAVHETPLGSTDTPSPSIAVTPTTRISGAETLRIDTVEHVQPRRRLRGAIAVLGLASAATVLAYYSVLVPARTTHTDRAAPATGATLAAETITPPAGSLPHSGAENPPLGNPGVSTSPRPQIPAPVKEPPAQGAHRPPSSSREHRPHRASSNVSRRGVPPRSRPARMGVFTLVTDPWTSVSIDGQPAGVTPLFRYPIAAGSHDLHLVNAASRIDVHRKVRIQPGTTPQKLRWTLTPGGP